MGLTKIKNWLKSDPSGVTSSVRRVTMMALPVLLAAFAGAGMGGVIGTFVIASAPALPVMPAVTIQPPAIVAQSQIEVEPLEAPPRPALALTIPGAPHRPALYALLLSGEVESHSDAVIAGAPHRLSSFAQLFWFYGLQEQAPERVIPGPAHKPAELAALYAQSLDAAPSPLQVIPGAPHRPAETGVADLVPDSLEDESGARLVWVEKPDPAEPGRLN